MAKIRISKPLEVSAKTLKIHMKVCDQFCAALVDADGNELCEQTDDYVPSFMPDEHYGDYLIIDIDIDTGMITNWKTPSASDLQAWVDKCNGKDD